jgi:1-acyl-sn-glycerol-3-phosphate acyltransferase
MKLLRRAITVPLVTVVMVCVLAFSPLLLAVAGAAGLVARSSRPVRTVGLVMAYAVIELDTLWKLLRDGRDCDQFMWEFLERAYTAVRRTLDVQVVLDDVSPSPEQIPREAPIIVLSRHCGPGDTILVAWLLAIHYKLRPRIVLKRLLLCEPVLDLAGDLKCLCFLPRNGDKARQRIHDLAASLGSGYALLVFPEGGNFTWTRWRAAIARLRSSGRLREARRAWRQTHTLPPRTGGTAAALSGAPEAAVLVLSHTGFSPDGRSRRWWQLPVHRQLLAHAALIPRAQLPEPDQLTPWLERTWSEVDAWVVGHSN